MLSWHKDSVAQICDSALLLDDFGGLFVRKRMDRDSIVAINTLFFDHLTLIRYGQHSISAAHEATGLPGSPFLYPNFPNPFNPSTVVRFRISQSGHVTLTVFDLLGRRVETLADGLMSPGIHERTFEARGLPSGVYLCRFTAGLFVQTTKMLVLQ